MACGPSSARNDAKRHSPRAVLPQVAVTTTNWGTQTRVSLPLQLTRPGIHACWHLGPVLLKGLGEEPSIALASRVSSLPQDRAISCDPTSLSTGLFGLPSQGQQSLYEADPAPTVTPPRDLNYLCRFCPQVRSHSA